MELVNKLLINWKVAITQNRKEEERYKEEYEKGIRRKKGLEEVDVYFKKISEETKEIEEEIAKKIEGGKVDEMIDPGPVCDVIDEMI